MINILKPLPNSISIAVSGGPDSMAVLDFLNKGKRTIHVMHYNHGTEHANEYMNVVQAYCEKNCIDYDIETLCESIPDRRSAEDFWREKRYEFFSRVAKGPVVTAHHLDDAVETWMFTAVNGIPRLIPRVRSIKGTNLIVIRPFLTTRKKTLVSWCDRKNVPYVIDPTNKTGTSARAKMRRNLIPAVLEINPGIHKVIKKKILERSKQQLLCPANELND
tara:strand:- start:249 stop:905 length:657 start_codon:yes stop_codon:yes gene_type:complete